jgi:dUTP pyrophosphatase
MKIDVKLLDEKCIPYKMYKSDAGIDLKARISSLISVSQFTTETIPTGICVDIPKGYVGIVAPRSSMNKIGVSSEIGVIDEGYTGEISVCLTNNTATPYHVQPYDRIAQLLIVPVSCVTDLNVIEELPDKERGDAGFGSTGKS